MIFLHFTGAGGWKVGVVHSISCGSGNDRALASTFHLHRHYQSTSRISACGRKGEYILHLILCELSQVDGLVF